MRTEPLLVPGAIIVGCGLIGLGLYFGLRPPSTPPPGASAPVVVTATLQSPGAPPPVAGSVVEPQPGTEAPAPSGTSPPASRQLVEKAAKDALLAEKKAKFVSQCWEPALKKEPEPARAKYVFEITLDPSGREVARGISEPRGESRGDVGQCLRGLPMGLKVAPAPGAPVSLSIEITFP